MCQASLREPCGPSGGRLKLHWEARHPLSWGPPSATIARGGRGTRCAREAIRPSLLHLTLALSYPCALARSAGVAKSALFQERGHPCTDQLNLRLFGSRSNRAERQMDIPLRVHAGGATSQRLNLFTAVDLRSSDDSELRPLGATYPRPAEQLSR